MGCPINIPPGTVHKHNDTRITFVESVDGFVLRWALDDNTEYFVETAAGVRVRPTVAWLFEEFEAGRLKVCSESESTISEWRGRYLGLDRAAVMARQPKAVAKYDIALRAIILGKKRTAGPLQEWAKTLGIWPDPDNFPSGRSIMRHMDTLQATDEKVGGLCNRSGREKGSSPLPPLVNRLVHQAVALHWSVDAVKKMGAAALVTGAWHRLKEQGVPGLGIAPPTKTTIVNRINQAENMDTVAAKHGQHEANRIFLASGESLPALKPFDLILIDGAELDQVSLFSDEVQIPSAKLKRVSCIDFASGYVFPGSLFAGPYRSEMGMRALLGVLTPPVLTDEQREQNPMKVMFFGRIGRLRGDNDKAILPPSSLGNLANVVTRVELASAYGADEKSLIESYQGWWKGRMDGLPGTILSPRSRKRSIRRDPMAEASMTRADFVRHDEALRLEWNATGSSARGGMSPDQMMLEHISSQGIRLTDTAEVRRNVSRTVLGVLTTDGVTHDGILYRWNRTGITKLLSENLAAQSFASRLDGTARCDVTCRAFDWNLDVIEVFDEANNAFVQLWSTDPDYTMFLTRWEHRFHTDAMAAGLHGGQTALDRALERDKSERKQLAALNAGPYSVSKKAAALLETVEMRTKAKDLADDPDLTDFSAFMIPTDVGGRDRADLPTIGPMPRSDEDVVPKSGGKKPKDDWDGFEPKPRSNLQMLEQDAENDEGGIDWDDLSDHDPSRDH
jgi:hypothetical protein